MTTNKIKCLYIEWCGNGGYYYPIQNDSDIVNAVTAEFCGADIGDVLTLTLVEINEDEFNGLPEFAGW
jgi:hypothetical protein